MLPELPRVRRAAPLARDALERARSVFQAGEWDTIGQRAEKVRALRHAARETISPLEYLESLLHPWVGFVIMPLFALANAGVPITIIPSSAGISLGGIVGRDLMALPIEAGFAVRGGLPEGHESVVPARCRKWGAVERR